MSAEDLKTLAARIREALQNEDWGGAIPLLERWCELQPQHAPGWQWRANCLTQLNHPAEALICARQALSLEPENGKIRALVQQLESAGRATPQNDTVAPDSPPPTEVAGSSQPPPTEVAGTGALPAPETVASPTPRSTVVAAAPQPQESPSPAATRHTEIPPSNNGVEVPRTEMADSASAKPRSTTSTTALWKEGTVVEGRYDVKGVERGGMGEVYIVQDRELGIPVAVKTPLPSVLATESGRGRFLREAEAWIALGLHPNICTAYYVRMVGGLPRLFIEYLEGGDLGAWMQNHPSAEIDERLDLAIQIASGMVHAHTFSWRDEDGNEQYGVVHRDLKPANILLGSDGAPRVTDLGLVGRGLDLDQSPPEKDVAPVGSTRPAEPEQVWGTMTVGGVVMGTPPYMPPEQWHGAHAAGPPADIYAFGCILYELFCSRRPFILEERYRNARPELQLKEWEKLHCQEEAPDPQFFEPQLDEALSALILRCLEKDPAARPESFKTVRAQLAAVYEETVGTTYHRPQPKPARLLADSWNNRGVSFATLGQAARAQSAWQSALEADPHHIEASYNLALSRWRQGAVTDAEIANRMEEIRTSEETTWRDEHLGGRLALFLGQTEIALAELRTALEAAGGAAQVARDLALALATAAADTEDPAIWKESATVLSTRCAELSTDPAVLTTYALAMNRLGKGQEAARLHTSACRHDATLPTEFETAAGSVLPGIRRVRRLRGIVGRAVNATVSADGRFGMAVAESGKIHIWDLVTGEIARTVQPTGACSRVLALGPNGHFALTSSEGDPVNIWDLDSGVITHRLHPHAGMLNQLVVTPDGRRAMGVGTTGSLNVWDLEGRSLIGSFAGHAGFATSVAAAADGMTALSGGGQGELLLWDTAEGAVGAHLEMHRAKVTAVAISRGARTAISGCEEGLVGIWDLTARRCHLTLRGHSGAIRFVALSDDSARCVSGSADGTLRIWDLERAEPIAVRRFAGGVAAAGITTDWETVLLAHGAEVSHCSARVIGGYRPGWAVAMPVTVGEAEERAGEFQEVLESSRQSFETGDVSGALALVDKARAIAGYERAAEAVELGERITAGQTCARLRTGWEERVSEDHSGRVLRLDVSPDGRHVVSVGSDRQVLNRELATGATVNRLDMSRIVTSLALVDRGRRVLTGDLDGTVKVFDLASGECTQTMTGHEAGIHDLMPSFDGRTALTAGADQSVRLWHLASGRCFHVLEGHTGEVRAVAMSPDRRLGASGGDDGSLVLWNLTRGTSLRGLEGHAGAVNGLVWSGDGRFLLSAGADGAVRISEIGSGTCIRTLDCGEPVTAIAISPDGNTCAAGCRDGTTQLWGISSAELMRTFGGHSEPVTSVVFTPDGRRLLSAGEDSSIRSWYLDWEFEVKDPVDWDNAAEPYLQVFLNQHGNPDGKSPPTWDDNDVRLLLATLHNRGFGWIRPGGVARRLRRMANDWQPRAAGTVVQIEKTLRTTPATPKQRQSRRKLTRVAAVALVLAIPVIVLSAHFLSLGRIDYDDRQLANTRREVMEAMAAVPSAMVGGETCSPAKTDVYLNAFLSDSDPEMHFKAQHCLEVLDDPSTVAPLLDSLRPREAPDTFRSRELPTSALDRARAIRAKVRNRGAAPEVFTVLARMGDQSTPAIARFITDSEPRVSSTAAGVLAFRGSDSAVEVLLEHSSHPTASVRAMVAKHLRHMLSSGVLSRDEAMELLERMAGDPQAEVRLGVAESLVLFEGTAVNSLAGKLANDADDDVAEAAKKSLKRR